MFVALQAAGFTLKPSKLAFGPKSVVDLVHVISVEGVAVGENRNKAIQELCDEIHHRSVEFVTVGFPGICRYSCCD